MKKSRFSESQIVAAIKRQEADITVKEICRDIGISEATFHHWNSKYGVMEASDVKRPKELEAQLAEY